MSGLQQQQQEQHQQVSIKMEPIGPSSPTSVVNSNLVVRVDQNSETDLQALFDTVLKPDGKKPLQLPLRMRQLPKSFFNPPSTGSKSPSISHSRENSGDSAFGTTNAGPSCSGPVPLHSRAHSSPASLQQTYAVGATKQQQQQHAKQRSYDISSAIDELGPLPQGWEQARTPEGQIYYLKWVRCAVSSLFIFLPPLTYHQATIVITPTPLPLSGSTIARCRRFPFGRPGRTRPRIKRFPAAETRLFLRPRCPDARRRRSIFKRAHQTIASSRDPWPNPFLLRVNIAYDILCACMVIYIGVYISVVVIMICKDRCISEFKTRRRWSLVFFNYSPDYGLHVTRNINHSSTPTSPFRKSRDMYLIMTLLQYTLILLLTYTKMRTY